MMAEIGVAIVTGAGSGIGQAAAVLLARQGYRLALSSRTKSKLEDTAALIRKEGSRAETLVLPADLSQTYEAFAVVDETVRRWGRIDVLVNNAGWGWMKSIEESYPELLRTTFDINFFSAAHLIHKAWPHFLKQKSGCVVNVSSAAAHDPFPGFFAYAASKAAMESLGRSIANDAAQLGLGGIRAYSVAPGAVETPLLRSVFPKEAIPREKTLDPFEVAKVIAECIAGKAGLKNGGSILVPSPQ